MHYEEPDKLALDCLESELQSKVKKLARTLQWRIYHNPDSIRCEAGFPDLVLVRHGRLIFAELKKQNGKLSSEQRLWLKDLAYCGVESYIWVPSDWNNGLIQLALMKNTDPTVEI